MAFNQSYTIKSGAPAVSTFEDDMISTFMNSSSTPYMAADKEPNPLNQAEQRRLDLLQQMKEVQDRTLESSKRSIIALSNAEKSGIETSKDLIDQREQLQNAERNLDNIESDLKESQKSIDGIKSVFSSLKMWWSAPKKKNSTEDPVISPKNEGNKNSCLSSAVQKCEEHVKPDFDMHPALKLRGIDEEENDVADKFSSDFQQRCKEVDSKLEEDLNQMSSGLTRLKGLATGLGAEIEDQNAMISHIQTKADKAQAGMELQNAQMRKFLKR